ncbi:flagellar hook-associated protein FlgL [Paenibacillus gorillae]|uniref:flagellar hook-associated protein FlgL n=1 Tax=Paenibacillus gorillae TaxID=1243662 RepID=UPI0004B555F9|nr:flagellar hook-associated protein FlgL [Paenibacillus gorillae]
MSLRVTQGMMHLQLSRNINKNLKVMSDLQNVSSTGMKLNKPSDDPVGITYSLRYRAELSANVQYQKNADQALSWLDFSDTVISQAGDVMQRLKELATNASNGTNPQEALDAIKSEIVELKKQLVDIGNSKMNGKYVFNGEKFDQAPYDDATTLLKETLTDNGSVRYALGANVTVDINLTGNQVFGNADLPAGTTNDNVFSVIDRIMAAVTPPANYSAVSSELSNIESSYDRMLNARAEIGAKVNRIELMQGRLADFELSLTDLQSKVEDADLEQVLIDSKTAQTIYEASLSVGAKVISRSLVDFLN